MSKKPRRFSKGVRDFSGKILKLLSKEPNKPFNYKQIAARLDVDDTKSRNEIIKDLKILASKKDILEIEPGKYIVKAQSQDYYEGIIDMTARKTAYLLCEDFEEDVFIPFANLNHALHGDKVKVYVYNRRKGKRPEAEVIEVIERERMEFVGVIDVQKNFAFVTTANPKMYTDIFIPKEKIGEAKDGDVVLVKIEDWPKKADSPFGSVEKVLGRPGEHDTEIHAILAEYGLPYDFPVEVEAYAKKLDTTIQPEEIAKRRDMRNVLTFTIDPKDAKDFDDALSFQVLENGNYEIGVHIADVSHYVQEGTILDDEAFKRATSVYLVDRVVPMLPEVLSNFACSLRPHEEKYTFSAVFEINAKAQVVNQWFGRTVIYSDQRFAYEEAQHIIETKGNTIPAEISLTEEAYIVPDAIVEATLKLDELAKILRRNRMNNGAISFDKVEVKFKLDENDEPVGVYFKIAKDANHLIEEFMLLANRKVAEFIGKQKKTFVYRIHDEPDENKLMNLQGIISKFGYSLNFKSKDTISKSLNTLLENVAGKKEQNMVDTLAIRTMSKAKYSTENIGHYGLAFDYYSHFTSPIRRYPDVMVHRLLQQYLDGAKSADEETYEEKCIHSSNMENSASNAERDSIKYMQVKYMQDHKDQEFLGVISGVTEWGIYVEIIENRCEGMIRIREIKEDYYTFDEKQYALVGQVTKDLLQLGDEVLVKVKNADLVKKQLDYHFIRRN
ncbi:ribonuclease R [Flavobacterium columnare]|uniref:ribonuclease R n=1 Tax=Flavobacterium columnare TaxID=996 RepID=UPI0007F9EEFB|nr:ribonuclease R [Flavobacterium columnare]ANO49743.1 ribonuclease R [Flavobacterium columnare]APT22332.1 ribonuclease R [Flavobacterium columnare]MBF6653327.1 ribonuclease R [Flavobacterium columnare]MBF6655681.1 ribonuclease R [Flavobacterium columnare]MBF6658680.1 ribonuclease R [Flavobacterium columnare]